MVRYNGWDVTKCKKNYVEKPTEQLVIENKKNFSTHLNRWFKLVHTCATVLQYRRRFAMDWFMTGVENGGRCVWKLHDIQAETMTLKCK